MRVCSKLALLLLFTASFTQFTAHALTTPIAGKTDLGANSVTWTVETPEISALPGDTITVKIRGESPAGWHTYSLKNKPRIFGTSPTVVELVANDSATIASAITIEPPPIVDKKLSKMLGGDVEILDNKFVMSIPVKLTPAAALNPLTLTFKIKSRICNEGNCKQEANHELKINVTNKKDVKIETPPAPALKPKAVFKGSEVEWLLPNLCELKSEAKPGELVVYSIKAMIDSNWYIYTAAKQGDFIPVTTFTVLDPKLGVVEGPITYDRDPIKHYDAGYKKDIEIFEEAIGFKVPIRLGALTAGEHLLTIKITAMSCNKVCKPANGELAVVITVPRGAGAIVANNVKLVDPTPPTASLTGSTADTTDFLKEGFGAFLWAAALGGLISLLTPCVFPMIPITVSFFTKRKHVSHAQAVGDAAIFSLGIILTYVGVGFFFAIVLGQNASVLATNPWTNLAIFALFMVMAFSLLGFYELQLPTGLINKLNQSAHGGNTKVGLLLMGLVFTLTSFSCTGPFVGTVMAAATRGNWLWPMLGMTVFAAVFALPFFFLAIFPAMLKSLPKSGGWMNSVKVVMGLVEIGAALKFLSNADLSWHWGIITRPVFVGLWLSLAVLCVIYLLGWIRFPHDTKLKKFSLVRVGFVAAFLAICGLLIADLSGRKGALGTYMAVYPPPHPYPAAFTHDWESGLAAARKECKPVFFDFTGVNCVNCRLMEEDMFVRKEIDELLKKYVVIRLYTDKISTPEEIQRSQRNMQTELERYNKNTLPFYAIVTPDGEKIKEFDDGYTTDEEKFKKFLKAGLVNKVNCSDLASSETESQRAKSTPR